MLDLIKTINPEQPVLIAGPTASGKSAVALEIAAAQGGVIVNADALQVFANWRVLTARPSVTDEKAATHRLKNNVVARLERQADILTDIIKTSHGFDKTIAHILGMRGQKTYTLQPFDSVQFLQQSGKRRLTGQPPTIRLDILSQQHDLPGAVLDN